MLVSDGVFCVAATIDLHLDRQKDSYVPLLLSPEVAKELSKFIKDLAMIDYVYKQNEYGGKTLDIHIQR